MRTTFFLCLLIFSCANKEGVRENQIQKQKLTSITCSIKSLEGEHQVYTIKQDSLFTTNKKYKLSKDEVNELNDIPTKIENESKTIGCGVCVDAIDFKFEFNFSTGNSTVWSIQPGVKMDSSISDYFNSLISKYEQLVQQ